MSSACEWRDCQYPGCNRKIWSVRLAYCQEHKSDAPKGLKILPHDEIVNSAELEELKLENMLMAEAIEELKEKYWQLQVDYLKLDMAYQAYAKTASSPWDNYLKYGTASTAPKLTNVEWNV